MQDLATRPKPKAVAGEAVKVAPSQADETLGQVHEQQLILRAGKGNHAAFTELLRAYDRRVMAVILRFTANRFDREDLYQDIFIACYRALPRFRQGSSFYTWIYRIAMNQCISFMRRQKPVAEAQDIEISDGCREQRACLKAIADAQARLTGAQQICFHLYYVEQWSLEEISGVLECNTGTVKSHLHRAREKVRADEEVRKWNIAI